MAMTIATEFPDYDPATLPEIPAGWVDQSWHNDACPCFETEGLQIYIDYADPSQRDIPDMPRFSVQTVIYGEAVDLLTTDDWSAVLAIVADFSGKVERLADGFSKTLQEWLTPDQMTQVMERNGKETSGACHSHDFCDANEAMLQAFKHVFGRDMLLGDDDDDGKEIQLVNRAWSVARERNFAPKA